MLIKDDFLNELRMRSDIEALSSGYVNLKRSGRTLVGLCPFHNEKTPSFHIYLDTQSFYCFGCQAGGDVITFVMMIENLDYVEAVKLLAEKAGLSMPEDGFDNSLYVQRKRICEINRYAAKYFHKVLYSPEGKAGLDYLKNRNINDSTIKKFGLGFAPDSWDSLIKEMKRHKVLPEEMELANLANKSSKGSYYDVFRNRFIIPIIDLRGNVVAFGGRVLDGSKPKYVNTSDTLVYKKSQTVFAFNFAKNYSNREIIISEGYMDVIALHQAGFKNAVACLGTAITEEQARLISRYADTVTLAYDSDGAGQEATERAIKIFNKTGVEIKVASFAGGKDPDEIIQKYGAEKFKGLLEQAGNNVEYRLSKAKKNLDIETSDGKIAYLKSAIVILADLNSPIERDVYAGKLSEELGVGKDAILSQCKTHLRKKIIRNKKAEQNKIQTSFLAINDRVNPEKRDNLRWANAEERLISLIMYNPDFIEVIEESLDENDFVTAFNKRVFKSVCKHIKEKGGFEITYLSGEFSPAEMGRIAGIQAKGAHSANSIKERDDCIKVILEEKENSIKKNPADMTAEEWRNAFKKSH